MTKEEFWNIADTWYKRTGDLLAYAMDVRKPEHKREQAARLFFQMNLIMENVKKAAFEISMPKPPKDFKEGDGRIKDVFVSDGEKIIPFNEFKTRYIPSEVKEHLQAEREVEKLINSIPGIKHD